MHETVDERETGHRQVQERCAVQKDKEKRAQAAVVKAEARKKAAQAALQVAEAEYETARQLHATSANSALESQKETENSTQSLLTARTQASFFESELSGNKDLYLLLFRDAVKHLDQHSVRLL